MFRLPVAGVLLVLAGGYMLAEKWLSGGKAPVGAAVAGSLIFSGAVCLAIYAFFARRGRA